MIRFALTLAALTGPMIAATSLQSDIDYWHAAHIWQHASPFTFWPHELLVGILALWLVRRHATRRKRVAT